MGIGNVGGFGYIRGAVGVFMDRLGVRLPDVGKSREMVNMGLTGQIIKT